MRKGKIYRRLAGSYSEEEQLAAFLTGLRADDVVFELGANIGTWSVFLGMSLPHGDLHVFEPEAANRAELIGNLKLNRLQRVSVHALAVSDTNGTASFGVVDNLGDGRHSLVVGEAHTETVEVETIRLDEFCRREGVRAPTAIKIDVEGAEAAVVRGMEEMLRARIPRVVFVEIHRLPGLEEGQSEMHRRLTDAGYRVERTWDRGGEEQRMYLLWRGPN